MGYPLGPLNTTDNYPADGAQGVAILTPGPCSRVNIWVSTNAAYYSLKSVERNQPGPWGYDQYLPVPSGQTAFISLDRLCAGIRFKSGSAGKAAAIVAELIPEWELPASARYLGEITA